MYRQGDVLLIEVSGLPSEAAPLARDGGRVVLAYGEVTGHAHAIYDPGAALYAANDDRYLLVTAPVSLRHEEHSRIGLHPGVYRVVRQREYSPEEIRYVAD